MMHNGWTDRWTDGPTDRQADDRKKVTISEDTIALHGKNNLQHLHIPPRN